MHYSDDEISSDQQQWARDRADIEAEYAEDDGDFYIAPRLQPDDEFAAGRDGNSFVSADAAEEEIHRLAAALNTDPTEWVVCRRAGKRGIQPLRDIEEVRNLLREAVSRLDSTSVDQQKGALWRVLDAAGMLQDAMARQWRAASPSPAKGNPTGRGWMIVNQEDEV